MTIFKYFFDHFRSSSSISNAFAYINTNMPSEAYLWGIVNNAGISIFGIPMEFLSIDDYSDMMKVNYLGPVNITLTFLPLLKKTKGRIVNVCSLVAKMPTPLCGSYCATKSALYGFSECLRREKQSKGIKVASIFPGHYNTGECDILVSG